MSELRLRRRGPYWQYSFEGARIDGKRQTISKSGFHTKTEASAAGAQAMSEYNRAGAVFKPSEISVSDYHSLRHTHATMLAEKGASPKYVQYRLGHKNIQVTMQIYQHLTDKMSEEGARLLDLL